ncbi:MAG: response regulator [Actinomycetota bacterium]|nr:response regulator [Actinomycetota bacterium]
MNSETESEKKSPLILVADDDRDLVFALSLRLRSMGYRVIEATDGEDAFQKTKEYKPDLVILDVRMPSGGGFSSLERMKHSLYTRTIPVIFLTAFEDEEMREEARLMGAKGFFRKPFDDEEFMSAIENLVGSPR